ncbi:hypothetical protein IQ251_18780 [Saccharopolyspora sp. HNM0983]|uniref:O-antigen/teichoic acid export membrane protein n=1 Tax=Saccharopolyspora montiporae TaxID=2781240 RepID=A0A929BCZ6_9PSEU|nr:hypothetical protein [Saccharopolyspora sp. HNM0983]MBE9376500.1 hypothetical protein [Saccharopolyspora sp. HNM0983]
MTGVRPGVLAPVVAANAVQLVSGSLAALVSTLVLGAEQRGVVVLGVTIGGAAGLLGGLGTGNAVRHALPRCLPEERAGLVATYSCCLLVGTVLGAAGACMAAAASGALIGAGLGDPAVVLATGLFGAGQVLLQQINDLWYADGLFRRGSAGSAAARFAGLCAGVLALLASGGAAAFLFAQAAGTVAVGIGQLVQLHRAGLFALSRPDPGRLHRLLRRGAASLGMSGGLLVASRADRYLLGVFAGPAAVGVYALAGTLAELARVLPTGVGQLFLRDAAVGSGLRAKRAALRTAMLGGVLTAIGVGIAGWLLIVPIFGAEYGSARRLLLVLLVAELCFAPFAVAGRGLLGAGLHRAAARIGLVAALVSGGVYLIAVGAAGAAGAAVASVLVYAWLSGWSWSRLTPRTTASAAEAGVPTSAQEDR